MNPIPATGSPKPDVLVVDDTPENLRLLVNLLSERGCKVRPVPSGELALRAARASRPDLILLDVSMPGIDGYETCRLLKSIEIIRDIPVIFISAHDEPEDKVRAFRAGGVDYVTKPFNVDEVAARVGTHLTLHRQRQELEDANGRLRELEALRESLTHMLVHDMRSPLLAIDLGLDLVAMEAPQDNVRLGEMLALSKRSVRSLVGMVSDMLDVGRLESDALKPHLETFDLVPVVEEIVRMFRPAAGDRQVRVDAERTCLTTGDPELVRRVVQNLLGNAVKFTPCEGSIDIVLRKEGTRTRVEVADTGPGIEPAFKERIFEKYGQVDSPKARKGFGLGLAFARMAVEAHGGSIGVNSNPGKGSRFWFIV